jgi:hypothetical protein
MYDITGRAQNEHVPLLLRIRKKQLLEQRSLKSQQFQVTENERTCPLERALYTYTHSIGCIKNAPLTGCTTTAGQPPIRPRLPPSVRAASFRNIKFGYTTGHDALTGTRLATES